jgi:hypothetical protein
MGCHSSLRVFNFVLFLSPRVHQVIDRMLAEATQLKAVCQVCPAASRAAHNIDTVLGML